MDNISEKREDEEVNSLSEVDENFIKANSRYLLLGKVKRVLWWTGLVLLCIPVFAEWIGGDFDAIFCGVLTGFPPHCDDSLDCLVAYVLRSGLIMMTGTICWIAVIAVNIIQSDVRTDYPEIVSPPWWRRFWAICASLLTLIMSLPVVFVVMLALP